jgi:hypothetical protein
MPDPTAKQVAATNATPNANIDIEKLTEKVYQLMRAELRLERTRSTKRNTRK